MSTLSKLHEKCKKCPNVKNCTNKRKEACAIAELPNQSMTKPYTPVTIHMGVYGDIHTSMEEIKENIAKEINKSFQINCMHNKF